MSFRIFRLYCGSKSLLSNNNNYSSRRWKSTIKRIDKLLIANRGEIACRVMRTARRLGVKTVAVYSDADANSLHVSMADEAYRLGPALVSESYLCADKILGIATRAGCQAIHPGYGFLSENAEFSEHCQKHDIVFIGPPASAIRSMGIKSTSKLIMSKAGVPIIEGYHGDDQTIDKLKIEAKRIGFPVMIKAVRGGGGKGMRVAATEAEFVDALESARSESQKAFGDSVVLLEKFVGEPRHVEVQVFGDQHGNVVHLFERDCSVQRRHQKIIEEAPAPHLSQQVRSRLGEAAVQAAKAVDYVGAGTVEFILDRHSHKFYFMEMNTRLQVEHVITEMITGVDLVEWQIKIASGEKIPLIQEQVHFNGHSFEARIYAEDPSNGFLPDAGQLLHLSAPSSSAGDVRVETGVREGDEVSVHYDPMIAKLIVWGNDRSEALLKLQSKLVQYHIAGLKTNVNFLLDLAKHSEFILGNVHTNFIEDNYDSLFKSKVLVDKLQLIQAVLAVILNDTIETISLAKNGNDRFNPFVVEVGFRPNYQYTRDVKLKYHDKDLLVKIKFIADNQNTFHVSLDNGKTWKLIEADLVRNDNNCTSLKLVIDDVKTTVDVFINTETVAIFDHNGRTDFQLEQITFDADQDDKSSQFLLDQATALMPGILDKVLVNVGDQVQEGDVLFVLIAMKMEYVVRAGRNAIVSSVSYKAGDSVPKDAVIVRFE